VDSIALAGDTLYLLFGGSLYREDERGETEYLMDRIEEMAAWQDQIYLLRRGGRESMLLSADGRLEYGSGISMEMRMPQSFVRNDDEPPWLAELCREEQNLRLIYPGSSQTSIGLPAHRIVAYAQAGPWVFCRVTTVCIGAG
jgi:hypothetical protein